MKMITDPDPITEELEEELEYLGEIAKWARYVYDAWVDDRLTRQNGMTQLRKALERAGY